jgi:hypothetical protein
MVFPLSHKTLEGIKRCLPSIEEDIDSIFASTCKHDNIICIHCKEREKNIYVDTEGKWNISLSGYQKN